MIRVFLVLLFMNPLLNLKAENPSVNYIAQYKEIAIIEMQRTGIPASIKMAQALLESGAGKSTLAREANNHFGIKCHGWTGAKPTIAFPAQIHRTAIIMIPQHTDPWNIDQFRLIVHLFKRQRKPLFDVARAYAIPTEG